MSTGRYARAFLTVFLNRVYCGSSGKDNGFGNKYVWAASLDSGLKIATNHKKPVMLIIHKSYCSACTKLKPKFAKSNEIQDLSKHFVMINIEDDDEPESVIFAPDGNYIPRILFMSPNGRVESDVYNEDGSLQHKYFYSKPEQIAKSMRKVIKKYKMEKFEA